MKKRITYNKRRKAAMYDVCHRFMSEDLTIRKAAKLANVSKSSLHNYIQTELMYNDKHAYLECRAKLEDNLANRHIRGGLATKRKYERMKQSD